MPNNMTLGFRQPCDNRTEEAGSDYHPFNHNRLRRLADTETDRMRKALEPTQDSNWILTHEGYNVLSESAVESRLAFGNGFLGMRAARSMSRGPSWVAWLGYSRWARRLMRTTTLIVSAHITGRIRRP